MPPIIRTGAVKTAQDRVCAHSVDRRGWEEMNGPARAADRPSMRKARISIRCHQAGQARLASSAIEAYCRLRQPLRAGFATVARLREQGKKRVSGMSGHAHAMKELLLNRQRIEQVKRGYFYRLAGG